MHGHPSLDCLVASQMTVGVSEIQTGSCCAFLSKVSVTRLIATVIQRSVCSSNEQPCQKYPQDRWKIKFPRRGIAPGCDVRSGLQCSPRYVATLEGRARRR